MRMKFQGRLMQARLIDIHSQNIKVGYFSNRLVCMDMQDKGI